MKYLERLKSLLVAQLDVPARRKYSGPPTIPPNATLQFDVELLSWANIVDVCKDGGILKRIISQGEKYDKPKDRDEVTVKYEAKLENGMIVEKSPEEGVEFYVHDVKYEAKLENGMLVAKTPKKGVEFYVHDGHFCPAILLPSQD